MPTLSNNEIVVITSKDDLIRLGEDMKRVALDDPIFKPHEYAKDAKSFQEVVEKIARAHRQNRAINFGGHIVTCELTMDKFNGQNRWHLSMCEQVMYADGRVSQAKVPDEPAKLISETILGGTCEEEPHPGKMIPCIRHFLRNAE